MQVADPHLGHRVLGGSQTEGLDLRRLRSCTSSIRAGWIRPSLTSSVSVMRAVSRRTGSKQDSSTDSKVSSIITLTPVTCSKARMLRPSRPMIRPFMSSPGRCTADTTDSDVCSEATRWMAPTTIIWAAHWPRATPALDVAGDQHRLALGVVLDDSDELGLGLLGRQPREALQNLLLLGLTLGQCAPLGLQLRLELVELMRSFLQTARLGVQPLLTVGEPLLSPLQIRALLPQLGALLARLVGRLGPGRLRRRHHRIRLATKLARPLGLRADGRFPRSVTLSASAAGAVEIG